MKKNKVKLRVIRWIECGLLKRVKTQQLAIFFVLKEGFFDQFRADKIALRHAIKGLVVLKGQICKKQLLSH